jgi:hypothetical protein
VKADLNKDVLIFTPAGPATAAAYLQHDEQDHKKIRLAQESYKRRLCVSQITLKR